MRPSLSRMLSGCLSCVSVVVGCKAESRHIFGSIAARIVGATARLHKQCTHSAHILQQCDTA